jgi:hypothetical protein
MPDTKSTATTEVDQGVTGEVVEGFPVTWERIGEVPVDSGMITVLDPCNADHLDYDNACDMAPGGLTSSRGRFQIGAVTRTAFGDGCYDVVLERVDGHPYRLVVELGNFEDYAEYRDRLINAEDRAIEASRAAQEQRAAATGWSKADLQAKIDALPGPRNDGPYTVDGLVDPRLRMECFLRDDFRCVMCGQPGQIRVMHATRDESDLYTVCRNCTPSAADLRQARNSEVTGE